MRTRSIAAAASVGALALGGTAIAAADGAGPFRAGFLGGDPEEREAELAGDLAEKLDGVSPGEVRRALREVREEHHAERRREMAGGIAEELDADRADVVAALEKAERRGPQDFLGTMSEELGKSRGEVRRAFADAALDRAVEEGDLTEQQADRIRRRFREGPPGFHRHGFVRPGGPPMGPPGGKHGPVGPGGPEGPGVGFAIPAPPPR